MHGFVWWSPSHESALLSLPLCPMPYSDRKVHACSEGGSVTFGARLSGALTHGLTHRLIGRGEKVRKKKKGKKEKGRDRVRAHGTVAGGVTTAEASSTLPRCMSAAFHLANAGIRSPPICHPVLSVPRHRHRWRHATPRQHPHRKSLTLFSGPATGPARGLIMSRSNQHARRLAGGVGWFT